MEGSTLDYSDDLNDSGLDVEQTGDGNYIVLGTTRSYGTGGTTDAWLLKVR